MRRTPFEAPAWRRATGKTPNVVAWLRIAATSDDVEASSSVQVDTGGRAHVDSRPARMSPASSQLERSHLRMKMLTHFRRGAAPITAGDGGRFAPISS
jgi:hypothetical protein